MSGGEAEAVAQNLAMEPEIVGDDLDDLVFDEGDRDVVEEGEAVLPVVFVDELSIPNIDNQKWEESNGPSCSEASIPGPSFNREYDFSHLQGDLSDSLREPLIKASHDDVPAQDEIVQNEEIDSVQNDFLVIMDNELIVDHEEVLENDEYDDVAEYEEFAGYEGNEDHQHDDLIDFDHDLNEENEEDADEYQYRFEDEVPAPIDENFANEEVEDEQNEVVDEQYAVQEQDEYDEVPMEIEEYDEVDVVVEEDAVAHLHQVDDVVMEEENDDRMVHADVDDVLTIGNLTYDGDHIVMKQQRKAEKSFVLRRSTRCSNVPDRFGYSAGWIRRFNPYCRQTKKSAAQMVLPLPSPLLPLTPSPLVSSPSPSPIPSPLPVRQYSPKPDSLLVDIESLKGFDEVAELLELFRSDICGKGGYDELDIINAINRSRTTVRRLARDPTKFYSRYNRLSNALRSIQEKVGKKLL